MTGTGNATPPRPGLQSLHQGKRERVRGGTFAWCTPKGHSAPFPIYAAARDGFATSKRRQKGGGLSFECDAARLIESGNWQLACDGRGEVLHWCTPLSQPAQVQLAGDIRLCPGLPSPRGCATTTRRPRSRRRPRIGAGWDPVTKSIEQSNCLLRMSQTDDVFAASLV